MSRKEEQKLTNEIGMYIYERAMREHTEWSWNESYSRLRSCTAWVIETENFYLLRSYSTIVAVIDKASDTLVDVLREVYGYTATSAQHIAKFRHDYGKAKYGTRMVYTVRPL